MSESKILSQAREFGFDLAGVCRAEIPEQDRKNIIEWTEKGLYGEMDWYPKNMNLRLKFENLGFTPKSVIVLGVLYNTAETERIISQNNYKISRYAARKDYHKVIKTMGKPLMNFLASAFPENHFRMGTDSLPVSEKVLAKEAGLGWIGRNTNLINSEKGSYFFLSEILTDLELSPDSPVKDRCGKCRACLDACPTGALFEEYKINAEKCISYLTIESERMDQPLEFKNKRKGWIYGCDICQEVCPWNHAVAVKKNSYSTRPEFIPSNRLLFMNRDEIESLNEESFQDAQSGTSMERISFRMIQRNIREAQESEQEEV
ncbi:MAG TPA: tRNA epoxyqueuosine(34) reductase QueG [Leptospiraceae bacterium]|nr:tRNA epoxyqueuosine(34) reductase QueG [Leptospiraceae bacterium]